MKLIVDMNLSPRWVGAFAASGIEAMHWSTLGAKTAPDSEIMAYAKATHCIVLTHDLDFGAILAATQRDGPSVVQLRGRQSRSVWPLDGRPTTTASRHSGGPHGPAS